MSFPQVEQLVILIVVGLVALAKWAIKNAGESGSNPPPPARKFSGAQSEEERMRKFMEALGMPAGSAPRQPRQRTVARRKPVNPLGIPEIPGQPIKTEITSYKRRPEILPLPPAASPPNVVVTIPVPPGATEVRAILPSAAEVSAPAAPPIVQTKDVRAWLRSPETLRAAIIAREILGAPRALQSF